ncbi:hypothetical protein [Tetragenococcus halophilus]|uniref:hypothetical protein n=1 Tax=Tetragenococcus halophilus TaxID=51669 RepID=UPI00256A3AE7|nr:hypothetical protein [Tetragenococcus halophilus]GMG66735.1 hypothetical protein TEHIT2_19260 [Tetragenococcus halophilus]
MRPWEADNERDLVIGLFYNSYLEHNKDTFIRDYFQQNKIINYEHNNYIVIKQTLREFSFKFCLMKIYLEPYLNTDSPYIEYRNYYKDSPTFFGDHSTFQRGNDTTINFAEIHKLENEMQSFINANALTNDEEEILERFKKNLSQEQATKEEAQSVLDILTKYAPLATSVIDLIKNIFF